MIKKVVFVFFIVCRVWDKSCAQTTIDNKLIGVWEIDAAHKKLCMVFINQNLGAITNPAGLLYYYFSYRITSKDEGFLLTQNFPVYNDEKDLSKSLIQLSSDTTFLISNKINVKVIHLIQVKDVASYKKLQNTNPETFVRKPSLADLKGSWFTNLKKDTSLKFTFKDNNVLELKNYHTGKQIIGRYSYNFDTQPMSLDVVNDKGEIIPTIFIFENTNRLRLAGPKHGVRRTRFTEFGDNFHLTRSF